MTFHRSLWVLVIVGVAGSAPVLPAQTTATTTKSVVAEVVHQFGPYEALVFDKAMLSDVKVDAQGNVFLMLQPDQVGAQITMKISMKQGAAYRKWATGDETLVAQQNVAGGRTAGVWSDRIQTSANYIEYWAGGKCFLLLKKTAK